jgi:hypothetical protein
MITAQEARELASHDSKVNHILEVLEQRIRSVAPHGQQTRLAFGFLTESAEDEAIVADVLTQLEVIGFNATACSVYFVTGGSQADRHAIEFDVEWRHS